MKLRLLCLLLIVPVLMQAQRIQYTDPETDDTRRTNFDIIGRVSGNILIFKNNRNSNSISVYDNQMKLIQHVNLDYLPDRYTNIDFVQYPDFCYMMYEYQKKNIVHYTVVKLDGQGKRLTDPVDLDTTQVKASNSTKIYTSVQSEDKQNLMILKINSKNQKSYLFSTFLFNKNLELQDRHRIDLQVDERNMMFTNFELDNDGQLIFAKYISGSNGEYVTRVSLVTKSALSDTFSIKDIGVGDRVLDEFKIKVDNNNNKRYLISAFYYKQRRGNIEGLYSVVWDKSSDSRLKENLTIFNDQLRAAAKSSESNLKMAFNDFFIKQLVAKKDGGYLVISESEYTTARGASFNRWDYIYGSPYMGPMDYYSPFYNPYSPWNRYGGSNINRYNAENIIILSFDKNSNLEWSNVIPKSQFDDDGNNLISYQLMNTGGALHFLYNSYEGRTLLLQDQSIGADGKLTRYPTLRNLDKGYSFMTRYGKQISSNQIIIPCLYRNYLCFAKVDF